SLLLFLSWHRSRSRPGDALPLAPQRIHLAASMLDGQHHPFTYEELFERATWVVAAKAVSTVDAEDEIEHDEKWDRERILTTFDIIHVLKGAHADGRLVLVHYRPDEKPRLNGAESLGFDTSGRGDSLGDRYTAYMLFLTKNQGGRCELFC